MGMHCLSHYCLLQKTPRCDFSDNPHYEKAFDWYDECLVQLNKDRDPNVNKFFTLIALCHTIMSEVKDGKNEFQEEI